MTPRRMGLTLIEMLVVTAIVGVLLALLFPAVREGWNAARRSQCVGNLMKVVLSLHNQHDVHGSFPPGRLNRRLVGARAGWSTHALIVPYINQPEPYNEPNLARAPDREPANSTTLSTRLAVLSCPSDFAPDPGIDRFGARHSPPPNRPQAGAAYGSTNYRFGDGLLGGLVLTGNDRTTGPPLWLNEDSALCRSRRSP